MSRLKELREQRAAAHAKAVESLKVNPQTDESRGVFDKAMLDVDTLGKDIERIERADKVTKELELATAAIVDPTKEEDPNAGVAGKRTKDQLEKLSKRYHKAYMEVLRYGFNDMENKGQLRGASADALKTFSDIRKVIDAEEVAYPERRNTIQTPLEARDLSEGTLLSQLGTYTGLGFFIPAGFVYQIEQATQYYAPLLDGTVFTIMETATGQPLPYPTSNDVTQVATLLGEGVQATNKDVTASNVQFGAWKYTSGLVRVSFELLQDSAFDLEKWLANLFGIRWGRGMEAALTTGTGSSQPTGIVTAVANSGATAVIAIGSSESTGSAAQTGANSIGNTDLVALEHSVDPTYRRNARYMFHDQTLASLKKILDKYGRPLWTPSIRDKDPDTINGYPYVINQSVAKIAASKSTVVFGALDKFIVRKVKDLSILRLTERYADFGQVAFVSFARIDSNLIDAGTHPVNVLQQSS